MKFPAFQEFTARMLDALRQEPAHIEAAFFLSSDHHISEMYRAIARYIVCRDEPNANDRQAQSHIYNCSGPI